MKIIAITNQKGGTGKTSSAINLSCGLATLKKKILLIDLDPQANLTYSFGINNPSYTITDLFSGRPGMTLIEKEGLSILPADPGGLCGLADVELTLMNKPGRERKLKDLLKTVSGYDYIFIDSPPSLTLLTLNALVSADSVLIPMQMEVLALQGLTQLLDTIKKVKAELNPGLKIKGIIPCMYDSRRNLSAEVLQAIKDNFSSVNIFRTHIRTCVRIAEAPSFSKSIISYAPGSNGSIDYMKLAREFIKC